MSKLNPFCQAISLVQTLDGGIVAAWNQSQQTSTTPMYVNHVRQIPPADLETFSQTNGQTALSGRGYEIVNVFAALSRYTDGRDVPILNAKWDLSKTNYSSQSDCMTAFLHMFPQIPDYSATAVNGIYPTKSSCALNPTNDVQLLTALAALAGLPNNGTDYPAT